MRATGVYGDRLLSCLLFQPHRSETTTMSSFTILVTRSPFDTLAHQQAMDFIRAAISGGHQVKRIFFYTDAVLCASANQTPIQGQNPVALQWQELASQHHIPLQACIANALRRGLPDSTEAKRYELTASLHSAYQLVGLGEMASALSDSDRVIQF